MPENNRIYDLAANVLNIARNTLVINLRFMDKAISMLGPKCRPKMGCVAVDGSFVYYDPVFVLKSFSAERTRVARQYLHMVFHCVYQHFWISTLVDREYWDLACDIAVEYTINDLNIASVETAAAEKQVQEIRRLQKKVKYMTADMLYRYFMTSSPGEEELQRLKSLFSVDIHDGWYSRKMKKTKKAVCRDNNDCGRGETSRGVSSTGKGNGRLSGGGEAGKNSQDAADNPSEPSRSGAAEETRRDHLSDEDSSPTSSPDNAGRPSEQSRGGAAEKDGRNRPPDDTGSSSGSQDAVDPRGEEAERILREWKDIARQMKMDLESFSKGIGNTAGSLSQNLMAVTRERYDYAGFLKKFAALGERMKINNDEFDYIFYTYGLKLYEKMPLIEPLEYKDVRQVREFVIAIDTSGSTEGELVQMFVQKTYNILKGEENFFTRFNLHIIQCDADIQEDVRITSQSEFDAYLANMKIRGQGGTDFRPVFSYVDELIANHEFANLKGMIYFTDGFGKFPARQPDYSVAFVYVDEDYESPKVPVWAIKLVLQPDDIRRI